MHPDGYIQLKDRSKDIIISGGEEHLLDRGRGRALQAPGGAGRRGGGEADDKWGETPCAFVELKPGRRDRRRARGVVQEESRRLQGAALRGVRELPKTSTGKIQKFKLREMAKAV
jgi:fatty-acyl-CoA synthase